jgi:hypothetical protein
LMAVTFNTATDALLGTPPTPPTCTVRDAAGPIVSPALGSPEPARVSVILVGVTGTYVPDAVVAGDALGVAAELTPGTTRKPKRSAPATAAAAIARKRTRHVECGREDPRLGDPFIRFPSIAFNPSPGPHQRRRPAVHIFTVYHRPRLTELLPSRSSGPRRLTASEINLCLQSRSRNYLLWWRPHGLWRWPKTAFPELGLNVKRLPAEAGSLLIVFSGCVATCGC